MQLSQQQERYIANYLRDVALHIHPDVPASRSQRALELLETRLRRAIEGKVTDPVQDSDVVRILDDFGSPESHAEQVRPDASIRKEHEQTAAQAVWLGVCAHWGTTLGIPIAYLRYACFAAGLVTGPLALWAYLAAYIHLRVTTPKDKRATIEYPRIIWNVATCIVVATLLSTALDYALWGLDFAHMRVFERNLPSVGAWGWVRFEGPGYYPLTLFTTIPLAVLAGLPLAGGWGGSLKRLYFAILTLYGIYLSYGMASLVVGLILVLTEQFGGVNLMDYLPAP